MYRQLADRADHTGSQGTVVTEAEAQGGDWRDVVDLLRLRAQDLWIGLTTSRRADEPYEVLIAYIDSITLMEMLVHRVMCTERRRGGAGRRDNSAQWSPSRLRALATWLAGDVEPWDDAGASLTERRYGLLDRTLAYEVWVVHWPENRELVLHDHGGSAGAFHVVSGHLEETSTTRRGRQLESRLLPAGQGRAFGPDYVHSLVNPLIMPATSVHAYSPPISSITFYLQGAHRPSRKPRGDEWEGAP